jgi:hypothetical protein
MPAGNDDPEEEKVGPRRHYSDQERAEAMLVLAANGGNLSATAIDTGIPYHTLRHWAAGDRHPEAVQMAWEKMPPLADRLEEVVSLLAEGMDDPLKFRKAPLNQIAVALGILIDKVHLLRGQSVGSATTGVVAEILDPGTPAERLVVMAGRMGLRTPQDFGGVARRWVPRFPSSDRSPVRDAFASPHPSRWSVTRMGPSHVRFRPEPCGVAEGPRTARSAYSGERTSGFW